MMCYYMRDRSIAGPPGVVDFVCSLVGDGVRSSSAMLGIRSR